MTLAVYVQYDFAKEKRQALELWAERLEAIVSDGMISEVIPLHTAERA